jgi:hypothetical protein
MLLHAAHAKLLDDNDWRPRGPVGVEVQDLEARRGADGFASAPVGVVFHPHAGRSPHSTKAVGT